MPAGSDRELRWDAPGPGMWELDRSHYPGGTTTISQWLMGGCEAGMRRAFAELGMPADTLDVGFVNGFMYTRLRPLIAPGRATTKLPPRPILRLAVRLHPQMRRRAAAAERALRDRPWRRVLSEWTASIRPRLEAENGELQAVDVAALDDEALARFLEGLLGRCRTLFELHFYLHAFDLGPIGLLLGACERWGIAAPDVIPALAGASPSTSAPLQALARIRSLVGDVTPTPETVEELRGVSPEVGALVDDYLARRGRMLVTRYDLDGRTLEEQPALLLATVFAPAGAPAHTAGAEQLAATARAKVPEAERPVFDERLAEARATMDLRDDNGPNTVELPVGILRFGLLEAGRRLVRAGRVEAVEHVLELHHHEVAPLVASGRGPAAAELAARAADRRRLASLDPPLRLGPTEVTPPLEVLAPAHQALVGAVQSVIAHLGMGGDRGGAAASLRGAGIGERPYQGTARVATTPEEALAAMEPGDVLVVQFTTPAYNTVLSLAGAVVTAEGALLSHAAVMARELGIPAVIGAAGAIRDIPDGSRVEVDPASGAVRVLALP